MTRLVLALALLGFVGCGGPAGGDAESAASSAPFEDDPAAAAATAKAPSADDATAAVDAGGATAANPTPTREGSVVARAPANDALFVADEDHARVHAVALPAQLRGGHVAWKAPGRPAQVLASGDRVLVTIRQVGDGDGALVVLKRKPNLDRPGSSSRSPLDLEEIGRASLPADAWGVSITPDERTAIVTSAWTHKLSAVDLATMRVLWSVDVAREPRGIVVLPNEDRAYVSHLVGSSVTRVDGLRRAEPKVTRVELPASPLRSPAGVRLPASLGYSVTSSPSGDRVYFPRHALGAIGPSAWFGVGAIDVLRTDDDTPAAPARAPAPLGHFNDFVATAMKTEKWHPGGGPSLDRGVALNAPRAVVYRRSTDTLLVANEGSDDIAEFDARAMDPVLGLRERHHLGRKKDLLLQAIGTRGAAPAGIALSVTEEEAYVFCRATTDLVILRLSPRGGASHVVPPLDLPLLDDTNEDKDLARGKVLFYQGDNGEMSGGLSCASCHPEGRDDGHTWHEAHITLETNSDPKESFTNFLGGADMSALKARWDIASVEGEGGVGYARQTPMLADRVKAKGPYGWHGESPSLEARIVDGFALHRWDRGYQTKSVQTAFAGYLARFLRDGLVAPPRVTRALTEEEQRGKLLFESPTAQCATCHVPQTEYTDRAIVPLPRLRPPAGFAEDPVQGYKTPSLRFVGGTPPYMHDGRFESLESLVEYNQDRMGKTAQLSPEDRKALIAFLRTL